MRLIFSKNVGLRRDILGRSACWNRGGFGKLRFWGHFEKVRGWKWRWRTLDILSDRFWNYFAHFQDNCKENGCGLGFLRILFLYRIQPPIFPRGVALFFHMALFFHVELPIIRHWRPLGLHIQVRAFPSRRISAPGRGGSRVDDFKNSQRSVPLLTQKIVPQPSGRFFQQKGRRETSRRQTAARFVAITCYCSTFFQQV